MEGVTKELGISVGVGLLLGVALTHIFKLYSRPTVSKYTLSIFGVSSQAFITYAILAVVSLLAILLSGISYIIRDIGFILESPYAFAIECIIMGLAPALAFLAVGYIRGSPETLGTPFKFSLLALKFAISHVLFQTSGFYSAIF